MPQLPQFFVLCFAVAAAISDRRTGLIPNRLILAGLGAVVAAVLTLAAARGGLHAVGSALLVCGFGLLACGLPPLAIYMFRALGGGDVKLLAMCGAGLGPVIGLEAELYAFTLGALFGLARAAYDGTLFQTLLGSASLLTNPLLPKRYQREVSQGAMREVRFGPFIAAGVAAAILAHWRLS
jgi:prepilin peptidase CpaA